MVLMLAPLVPHITEELWRTLGHDDTVTYVAVPRAPIRRMLIDDQDRGTRCRSTARSGGASTVAADADVATIEAAALADEKIAGPIARRGHAPKKVIVVPGRMVNIVA